MRHLYFLGPLLLSLNLISCEANSSNKTITTSDNTQMNRNMWKEIRKIHLLPTTVVDSISSLRKWNSSERQLFFSTLKQASYQLLSDNEKRRILQNDTSNYYWALPLPEDTATFFKEAKRVNLEALEIFYKYEFLRKDEYQNLYLKVQKHYIFKQPYYFFEDIEKEIL